MTPTLTVNGLEFPYPRRNQFLRYVCALENLIQKTLFS